MRECPYCTQVHGRLLLCEPARLVLDALIERGMRFDMPTLEFPDPVVAPGQFGPDTVLVAQLVAKGAVVPVAGVTRPAVILTGQDVQGNVLPQWVYVADGAGLRKASKLVGEMTEMAIRRARSVTL
jgi:hypothetical protein